MNNKNCSVENCDQPIDSKNLCTKHYKANYYLSHKNAINKKRREEYAKDLIGTKIRRDEYRKNNSEKIKKWKAKDSEKHAERYRKNAALWQKENPQRRKIHNATYRKNNPDKARLSAKKWRKNKPEIANARIARRRATKLNATPKWANEFFIRETYHLAKLRTNMLGIKHHVDHIVPLQSKLVCGLHVEHNLQVIPAVHNHKKSNHFWPDIPGTEAILHSMIGKLK